MFIEKPLSADSVENALQVADALVKSKAVVSVGYFLRYLRGASLLLFIVYRTRRRGRALTLVLLARAVVQKMREIIEENELEVMATNARYYCSYANIAKPAWWMKSKDCGPSASPSLGVPLSAPALTLSSPRRAVVEQGTHLVDLCVRVPLCVDTSAHGADSPSSPAGLATLAATSTSSRSRRRPSSGTSPPVSSPPSRSTSPRSPRTTASRASRVRPGSTRTAPSAASPTPSRSRATSTSASPLSAPYYRAREAVLTLLVCAQRRARDPRRRLPAPPHRPVQQPRAARPHPGRRRRAGLPRACTSLSSSSAQGT